MNYKRITLFIIVTFSYLGYVTWDYHHHLWLVKNVSKNMWWLHSLQYSWDLILISGLYILFLYVIIKMSKRT